MSGRTDRQKDVRPSGHVMDSSKGWLPLGASHKPFDRAFELGATEQKTDLRGLRPPQYPGDGRWGEH